MEKATFSSVAPNRKPTHWRHLSENYVMWRADSGWNRIYGDKGTVSDNSNIAITPLNEPHNFIPCYGDLVITISSQD